MRNLVLVLALLLGSTISVTAQSNQSRIVDLSGNGIPEVEITEDFICLRAGRPIGETRTRFTDANGNFEWVTISPVCGSPVNVITLKKPGYIFTRSKFTYASGIIFRSQWSHR